MAELYTGADSVRVHLTGAAADNAYQGSPALSLGGCRSSVLVDSLTAWRRNPIPGIVIRHAAGANGKGIGTLYADSAGSLRWTPPGGTQGASVAIANGETKVLPGGDNDAQYLVVSRVSSADMGGTETVQLKDTYRNLVGGSDFSSAERTAGAAHYRGAIFRNGSSLEVTGLTLWLDPSYATHTQMAAEETVAGAIQTIADEATQPTGLAWVNPTAEGTGLVLGTVVAGGTYGAWFEEAVAALADADARILTVLWFSFTAGGTKYTQALRGLHRVADAALAQYEMFVGTDAYPDLTGAPTVTGAGPALVAALAAGHTYYCTVLQRNQHNLATPVADYRVVVVNDDGSEGSAVPSEPVDVRLLAGAGGTILVSATYDPKQDEATINGASVGQGAATHFLVYARADGVDPVPGVDSPTVVAMAGSEAPQVLSYTTAAGLDGAPWRILVRTRRVDGGVNRDSTNTTAAQCDGSFDGPLRPSGHVTLGRAVGVYQGPMVLAAPVTTYIDEDKNIYWEQGSGYTSLYVDTLLVWRTLYDSSRGDARMAFYIPSDWVLVEDATIAGAAAATPMEVASWDPSDRVLYVATSGSVRRMKIDATHKEIQYVSMRVPETPPNSRQSAPAWGRYSEVCFQVWDPGAADWCSYMTVDNSGNWTLLVNFDQTLSQAQIEGL